MKAKVKTNGTQMFSIPNTPENLELIKQMRKFLNHRVYRNFISGRGSRKGMCESHQRYSVPIPLSAWLALYITPSENYLKKLRREHSHALFVLEGQIRDLKRELQQALQGKVAVECANTGKDAQLRTAASDIRRLTEHVQRLTTDKQLLFTECERLRVLKSPVLAEAKRVTPLQRQPPRSPFLDHFGFYELVGKAPQPKNVQASKGDKIVIKIV